MRTILIKEKNSRDGIYRFLVNQYYMRVSIYSVNSDFTGGGQYDNLKKKITMFYYKVSTSEVIININHKMSIICVLSRLHYKGRKLEAVYNMGFYFLYDFGRICLSPIS